MLNCKGAAPPVAVAVTIPFTLLHDAVVATALTVGPGELATVVLTLSYTTIYIFRRDYVVPPCKIRKYVTR